MQRLIQKCGLLVCVFSLLASTSARATSIPGAQLDIKLGIGANTWEWSDPIVPGTDGNYKVPDVSYNPTGASLSCYNMTMNYDPFMSASVDVVNNTALTQTYTLTFTLPISPAILTGTKMGGSTQGGLTDANNDFNGNPAATGRLSTAGAGTALYQGQIDGVDVLPLLSNVTVVDVPFQGGSNSTSASAGLPGPTIPGPNALTSIGIKHVFTLTPGDRATFTSFFIIQPVPEPASLVLLSAGGFMLLRRRR